MTDKTQVERIWRAGMVVIGDEILSGRTQDANVNYLARWLNTKGVRLQEVRVVSDDYQAIGEAVLALKERYDYVFTTGGIGPTHDDITVDAISKALGIKTVYHREAIAILEKHYGKDNLTERRKLMARAPEGSNLIIARGSGAPGIHKDNVFILAGIPSIMRGMLEGMEGLIQGGQPVIARTVGAMIPESEAAELLNTLQDENPDASIGSYPLFRGNKVGANFVVRSADQALVESICEALLIGLRDIGVEPVDGEI